MPISAKNITLSSVIVRVEEQGDVVLLLHFDGANGSDIFTDSSIYGNVPSAIVQPAVIDTTVGKFGSSGNFTGGYFQYDAMSLWDMNSEDFTIEFWARWNSSSVGSRVSTAAQANSIGGDSPFSIIKQSNETLSFSGYLNNGSYWGVTSTNTVVPDTWYHIAGVRHNTSMTLFVNGEIWATVPVSLPLMSSTNKFGVGIQGEYTYSYGGSYGTKMMGWLDEFRLTKGLARYTSPFVPYNGQFPNP